MSNSNKNSRRNRMEMLIYKITNIKNKEIYIGKCKNLQKRWQQHKSSVPKIVLVCQKKRKTHNNFVWRYI